jgi:hypothetical protein
MIFLHIDVLIALERKWVKGRRKKVDWAHLLPQALETPLF